MNELTQRTYVFTYLFTYLLRGAESFLTGYQLVKKFPAFYATRRFITAFISARHLSLSWASSIPSITPRTISWRSILILSSHLRLGPPRRLFPSGFPSKTLYTPLHATYPSPTNSSRFYHPNKLGVECRTLSSSFCSFLHSHVEGAQSN
jgi:hypothetical protein